MCLICASYRETRLISRGHSSEHQLAHLVAKCVQYCVCCVEGSVRTSQYEFNGLSSFPVPALEAR